MADDLTTAPTAADADTDARDYRETVFLPTTPFPMRAGLPKLEPELLARWEAADLYKAVRAKRQADGAPLFVFHDGPPYANGAIHIGHCLNKSIKDFVVRSRFALGYDVDYVPGWDCHGLPIEWKVEEEFRKAGRPKDQVPPAEFRARCREYAAHWMGVQEEGFKRLGVMGDWGGRYATMDFSSEAAIVAEFHKFLMSGQVYRGSKPVMWSPVERTALADAEVEYHDHNSPQVWVKFPVAREEGATLGAEPLAGASVVIWTTTPWTIPANRAVAYGPTIAYGLYEVESVADGVEPAPLAHVGERLIVAQALSDAVRAAAKIESWRLVRPLMPVELAGVTLSHPLGALAPGYGFSVPMLSGDHVTEDAGTGFVHTAPGHGQEDYQVWIASGRREIPETVDPNGAYFDSVPLFGGLQVIEAEGKKAGKFGPANGAVIGKLLEAGTLLAQGRLDHSYPHSWRSKAPVLYRNTPQWFIRLDEAGNAPPQSVAEATASSPASGGAQESGAPSSSPVHGGGGAGAAGDGGGASSLRATALAAIDATTFYPPSGQTRLRNMVSGRPDWLVSRQRAWGTPLALFVDRRTGEPLRDEAVNARIHAAVAEGGADAWFTRNPADFLGPERDPADYEKIDDILDVWFDSGCTHVFTLEGRTDSRDPADLYLEGSDQHRGWFQSSLLESCGTRGRAPYKAVVTHGMTLTDAGEKMSKSLGNALEPDDLFRQSGAEIIRLWAATVDYQADQRIGKTILQTVTDSYRKLRNTVRYLLGALEGFSEEERIGVEDMPPLERWVLHRLWELDRDVRAAYERYDFSSVWRMLSEFSAQELSALYFDIRKDSLYCDRPDAARRRACRTVMDAIFERLTLWLSPLCPFTMEEAWATRFPEADSNSLRVFPDTPTTWRNDELSSLWSSAWEVTRVVTGALEVARQSKLIGGALDACVYVDAGEMPGINLERLAPAAGLDGMDDFGAELFRTSQARIFHGDGRGPTSAPVTWESAFRLQNALDIAVVVTRADGAKCQRSWKVLSEVERNLAEHGLALTDRDLDAVRWRDAQRGHEGA